MTTFGTLFSQLFKQKNKRAYLFLAFQLTAAIFTVVISFIASSSNNLTTQIATGPNGEAISINLFTNIILVFMLVFLGYSFLFDFGYLINTSMQTERVNRSQTWRLVPMKDGMIYITNTLSSFASFVYLAAMQAVIILLCLISSYASSNGIRTEIAKILRNEHFSIELGTFLNTFFSIICFILIVGLTWYIVVSFLHFTTRAVLDFLPASNNKLILFFIRLIIFIAVIFILRQVLGWIIQLITTPIFYDDTASFLWEPVFSFTILSLILAIINYYLIDHWVEAKQNH